ncbi:MAG: EAL domain-containing protein [Woeseiaceae bacterium]
MLRLAAIARTEAEASHEQVKVYQPGREDHFLRRLRIANDLPAALRRDEVQVYFQPKISLPHGEVCGAEALVRWEHSDLGCLQPDDFGTGHSSLAQLRDIPLHELKIDKSFVVAMSESEHNETIVKTTISLAHSMNLHVVAEGVKLCVEYRRWAASKRRVTS